MMLAVIRGATNPTTHKTEDEMVEKSNVNDNYLMEAIIELIGRKPFKNFTNSEFYAKSFLGF